MMLRCDGMFLAVARLPPSESISTFTSLSAFGEDIIDIISVKVDTADEAFHM